MSTAIHGRMRTAAALVVLSLAPALLASWPASAPSPLADASSAQLVESARLLQEARARARDAHRRLDEARERRAARLPGPQPMPRDRSAASGSPALPPGHKTVRRGSRPCPYAAILGLKT
jgi:hypothetical protein